MDDLIEKFCKKFGVPREEFEEKELTDAERIEVLEECVLELAEMIGGDE